MNDHNEQFDALSPELAALDAGLAQLGATERASAPSDLEGRIIAATSSVVAAHTTPVLKLAQPEPKGIMARLSVKRLDWPMRVAAVIAVMIGGWAAFHGAGAPGGKGIPMPASSSAEAERLLSIWSTLENSGAAEKIKNMWLDAGEIESLVIGDGLGEPDGSEQENL